MTEPSKRRLIENEVLFRERNTAVKEFIQDETRHDDGSLEFYCECSSTDCVSRIKITPSEYGGAHRSNRHFIALRGHELPEIEKVVTRKSGYNILEKYRNPDHPEKKAASL